MTNQRPKRPQTGAYLLGTRELPAHLYAGMEHSDPAAWHRRIRTQHVKSTPGAHQAGALLNSEASQRALQAFDDMLVKSVPDFGLDPADYVAWKATALQRRLNKAESRNSRLAQENAVLRQTLRAASRTEPEALRREFQALASRWREETGHMSSAISFTQHPAYLRIIAMGPAVVPLILEDLERTRSHWFIALRLITGENPAEPEDRGNVQRLSDAWIAWGRERGLV